MFNEFRELNHSFEPLSDVGLVLRGEGSINTVKILLDFFEKYYGQRSLAPNDVKWVEQYDRFIGEIINRRDERAGAWLEANFQRVPLEHPDVVKVKSKYFKQSDRNKQYWMLCKKSCNYDQCSLPCLKNQHEESEGHDCKTDHKCHFRCEIKEAHPDEKELPLCDCPAGHRNRHRCEMRHVCADKCKYNNRNWCLYECSKEVDH